MIKSFGDRDTERFANREPVRRFQSFALVAIRKLRLLASAEQLNDLRVPPGNRLEPLQGKREGQYSIRINDQFRICFIWEDGDAYDVEIVDYH